MKLWQISEFQRTKAIHNILLWIKNDLIAVTNIWISKNKSNSQHGLICMWLKDAVTNIWISKNKSNSQHAIISYNILEGCDKYLNFKEQKQFTTYKSNKKKWISLWQISEFQRTKAIHNIQTYLDIKATAVTNIWISKNKSNSQLWWHRWHHDYCCDKYLNFKEQKQFTTCNVCIW